MNLTDELLAKLQGAPLQQVFQQLGISSTQASGAVSAALQVLLGALGNNAAQPQGAQALLGALQTNHSGLDLGGVLGRCWAAAVRQAPPTTAPASSGTSSAATSRRWKPAWPRPPSSTAAAPANC